MVRETNVTSVAGTTQTEEQIVFYAKFEFLLLYRISEGNIALFYLLFLKNLQIKK